MRSNILLFFFARILSHIDDIRAMSARLDEVNKAGGQEIRFQVGKIFNRLDVSEDSARQAAEQLLQIISTAVSFIIR